MSSNADKPLWALRGRSLMKSKGITQEDLINIFDVKTRGAVGHYFSGRRQPTIEQVQRLADCLGVTIDELISDSSKKSDTKASSSVVPFALRARAREVDLRMMEDAITHQLDYLHKAGLLKADPSKVAKSCVAKFTEYQSRKTAQDAMSTLLESAEEVRDKRSDIEGHDR